jgi:uroporphyrinogen-III synthase
MSDRRYTILSTASLPFERIPFIPDSADIRVVPFIKISPRQDKEIKNRVLDLATKKMTVIFTSVYAVKWVKALLNEIPDWKIYSIRQETRNAIVNWFGDSFVVHTAENAKYLSQRIVADNIQEAVFFCGDQRMDILPDQLKKNGVKLTELVVYDTRLTPVRIENPPDAVLFFSPTAVKSFFSMNILSPETVVFAMGTTTAATLKQFTTNPVIISAESDKAFVLKTALEYASSHPII